MPRRKMPVALMVATPLVTVVTLLIGAFGMARYAADHDEKWARLRKVNAVEADVLAISLALPVWNIDRPQIDKILQSMEGTPAVQAVSITAPGLSQTRTRIGNWLQPSEDRKSVV